MAAHPDRIGCGSCIATLALAVAGTVEDQTCDRCDHVCAGLPDDPIYPVVVPLGPVVAMFGFCSACSAAVESAS